MHELIQQVDSNWVTTGHKRLFDGDPPVLADHKGKWVPEVIEDEPTYNPDKHRIVSIRTVTEDAVTVSHTKQTKTVNEVAGEKLSQISSELDSQLMGLPQVPSEIQKQTYTIFSEQARLHKRNGGAAVRLLKRRAGRSSITLAQLRDKILAKSNAYEDAIGDATGDSDARQEAVDAAVTDTGMTDAAKINAILAVTW